MPIRHNFVSAKTDGADATKVLPSNWNEDHIVSSTVLITDLNADLWDGYQFADYFNQVLLTTSSPTFANLIITVGGQIRPTANSITALNIAQADGTNFIKIDTTNKRFKVGTVSQAAIIQGGDTVTSGAYGGLYGSVTKANTASDSSSIYGVNASAIHTGSANLTNTSSAGLIGGRYQASISSGSSGATISTAMALFTQVINSSATSVLTNGYSLYLDGSSSGAGTKTNLYHTFGEAFSGGSATNVYSIWLEKQTLGSTINSGIVLDGDGIGADLVLGDGQDVTFNYDGTKTILANLVGTGAFNVQMDLQIGTPVDATLNYTQLDTLNADTAGPPASGDCDASTEVGRSIVSTRYSATAEYRLWICTQTGASTFAWKYTVLN